MHNEHKNKKDGTKTVITEKLIPFMNEIIIPIVNYIIKPILYIIVSIFFIIYIYRVHDYLGEFKLNFQWLMIIFFIVWIIFPYISEFEIFGNKFKKRELQKKIESVSEKVDSIEQKDELQNKLDEKIYMKQQMKSSNQEDFNDKVLEYQIVLEIKLMNIYKKLRVNGEIPKKRKITFVEIAYILYEKNYITQNTHDDIFRFELIFSKENISPDDYKYIKERNTKIFEILDNVYKEI